MQTDRKSLPAFPDKKAKTLQNPIFLCRKLPVYQEHKDSMDINRMSFEIIMELFVRNQAVENNDEDLPF